MNGIAAKIAEEILVLLQNNHVDARLAPEDNRP